VVKGSQFKGCRKSGRGEQIGFQADDSRCGGNWMGKKIHVIREIFAVVHVQEQWCV
jgi:hypothetical protein